MTVAPFLVTSFALLAASVHAASDGFCSVFGTTYVVGDKTSDAACTHNDIRRPSALLRVPTPPSTSRRDISGKASTC